MGLRWRIGFRKKAHELPSELEEHVRPCEDGHEPVVHGLIRDDLFLEAVGRFRALPTDVGIAYRNRRSCTSVISNKTEFKGRGLTHPWLVPIRR